jgi:hypothetical protein
LNGGQMGSVGGRLRLVLIPVPRNHSDQYVMMLSAELSSQLAVTNKVITATFITIDGLYVATGPV